MTVLLEWLIVLYYPDRNFLYLLKLIHFNYLKILDQFLETSETPGTAPGEHIYNIMYTLNCQACSPQAQVYIHIMQW